MFGDGRPHSFTIIQLVKDHKLDEYKEDVHSMLIKYCVEEKTYNVGYAVNEWYSFRLMDPSDLKWVKGRM